MTLVSGIPFWHIILYFVVYLCIHVFIGAAKESQKNKLNSNPTNEEVKNTYQILTFCFKWFPFGYTLFVILMLLF